MPDAAPRALPERLGWANHQGNWANHQGKAEAKALLERLGASR